MPEPFRTVLVGYFATLERYRLLTFGQQIVRAVAELRRPEVARRVHADAAPPDRRRVPGRQPGAGAADRAARGPGRRAVRRRRRRPGDLPVARVRRRNIVTFADRYPTSRRSRSRPTGAAARRSSTRRTRSPRSIPTGSKTMGSFPPGGGGAGGRGRGLRDDELSEAGWIASLILDLHDARCAVPRHRRPRPRPGGLRGARRAVRDVRHPGPARRAHRPVRPA